MMRRVAGFNIYLLAVACALPLACQNTSPEKDKNGKNEFSTLHFHIQVNPDGSGRNEIIRVNRSHPVQISVERTPFLHEGHIVRAEVIDDPGGFAIKVQFDRHGTWLLENVSTAYKNRHVAIFSQFGDARWLGAPFLRQRITDGVFTFTPDATREEAERIVRGLNNVAAKLKTKSNF